VDCASPYQSAYTLTIVYACRHVSRQGPVEPVVHRRTRCPRCRAKGKKPRAIDTIFLSLLCFLTFSTPAAGECPWLLWVEAPTGSDQWSVASVPQSRFTAKEECQRSADDLNAFELTMHRMQGTRGEAHDAYSCQPCTVDPRPEGALLHEGANPRGPKGK
jgi:hypothetical protein